MTVHQLSLLAACVYAVVLVVAVYFTRATKRRVFGALAGGLAVAIVGVGVEFVCQRLGMWHYPSDDRAYGPLSIYPVLVLMWAVYSLIGWRVERRFGWRGLTVFLTVVTIVGMLRDYRLADEALGVIRLAPGPWAVLIDAACWAGLTVVAYAVMRLISGPAEKDPLARAVA